MSETLSAEIPGYEFILTGKKDYSDCLRTMLNTIHTPYILWLQDDYFFQSELTYNQLISYIKYISDNNIDRFGIKYKHSIRHYSLSRLPAGFYKMNRDSLFTISLQSSIWNTEFFKSCLIDPDQSESPWGFELAGSRRLNMRSHNIVYDLINEPLYYEAMKKGNTTVDYDRIIQLENIEFL
jgi:hypothetical protein